jgi:hypothetical protein
MRSRASALLLALGVGLSAPARAGDSLDDLLGSSSRDDTTARLADEFLNEDKFADLGNLRDSHLTHVAQWRWVKPLRADAARATDPVYRWQAGNNGVTPLGPEPIFTRLQVPTGGEYRISIRHELSPRAGRPVTLTLQPLRAAPTPGTEDAYMPDGDPLRHLFGNVSLSPSVPAGEQEKKVPVRFESEHQLVAPPSDPVILWEYWDVPLKAGVYEMSLATTETRVRVHAVFLSRSKSFRPSLSSIKANNTFGSLHVRYRLLDAQPARNTFPISGGLIYHWPRQVEGNAQPVWGWGIGSAASVPPGQWSPFINVTEAVIPGPGPWSTWRVGASGLQSGRLLVQSAWMAHEGAVIHEFETAIGADGVMFRYPNGLAPAGMAKNKPAWGVWDAGHFAGVMTEAAMIQRYLDWAIATEQRLGLKKDHPRLHGVRISSNCGVSKVYRERAADMLARLGINWIDGAPASVVEKYGLQDTGQLYNVQNPGDLAAKMTPEQRLKVEKIKLGDEISTYSSPESINNDPARLAKFHAYLQAQAKDAGSDADAFLGVPAFDDLTCIGSLSDNPGRYERRLFYHSQRFCHEVTADSYRAAMLRFEEHFPNARVYNNYTPHPVFLTGQDMNIGDWFVLCRNQAQSLGWAEDWATSGSWGLGTSYQCVSFYAALVECSVRKHGQPSGFYVGVNCGAAARKIFSCIARGLTWLELYSWGPMYGLAEGSNAWSEDAGQYAEIMQATSALAPADAIIAEGRREPRQVAILYNRSHEIWRQGGQLNHDWMWTYIGLASAQVPADVIIEEDLNAEDLARYRILYLGGYNLNPRHLAAIRKWVEGGGLLIGSGGAARRDLGNDLLPATIDLFGAEQRPAAAPEMAALTNALFAASDLFPSAIEITPRGLLHILKPVGQGQAVATYGGGACAAVMNTIGKGRTLLLGFHPGFTFRDARFATGGTGTGPGKGFEWLVAPVRGALGRPRAELDYHLAEVTLFEHRTGIAVLLAAYVKAGPEEGCTLSVLPGREIREVVSSLHGPLKWTKKGDRIEIRTPALSPIDVIILR